MENPLENPIQTVYNLLSRIQKAPYREGAQQGGVTINKDLNGGRITGTFSFPLTQEEDESGSMVIKLENFVDLSES